MRARTARRRRLLKACGAPESLYYDVDGKPISRRQYMLLIDQTLARSRQRR
jgi:hypothetical protein